MQTKNMKIFLDINLIKPFKVSYQKIKKTRFIEETVPMTLSPLKLVLAAASMATAAPAFATCPTSGCGQQPPANDPGQIIVSGTVNNNSTIGIRTDITSQGGTAYGGQASANIGDVAGGSVNFSSGAIAPVAQGGQGGNAVAHGGAGGSVGDVKSSSVSQGGSVNGLSTGNQSVQFTNPRNVGAAFAPAILGGGPCSKGVSVGVGTLVATGSVGFNSISGKCMSRNENMLLFRQGLETGNKGLRDAAFFGLTLHNPALAKGVEAVRNGESFGDLFNAEPATNVTTIVVPPAAGPRP
jgi:hypothetical protein